MICSNERVFRALARDGIAARKDGPVFRIRKSDSPHAPEAEVLLPEGFALESKAVAQLASFAAVRHPSGCTVDAL
jgi:tRNA-splicing ligase RtcB